VALEGPEAIDTALRTVEMLDRLDVRLALPAHGEVITDPAEALAAAHARYERMRADPARAGWHASKRIFAYALMIHGGIPLDDVDAYLVSRAWLIDHARTVFDMTPADLAAELRTEMRRTGAVEERDGRLVCRTPHHPSRPGWLRQAGFPCNWGRPAE
jgi:hypothetical protein